jgi:hypothetical protein
MSTTRARREHRPDVRALALPMSKTFLKYLRGPRGVVSDMHDDRAKTLNGCPLILLFSRTLMKLVVLRRLLMQVKTLLQNTSVPNVVHAGYLTSGTIATCILY